MTLIVWVIWRLFQKRQSLPHVNYFVAAIILSSLVFALGHLPIAFLLSNSVTTAVIMYVVVGNLFFGLIAGYLYW
ncbi:type II CAAX prenyl endopeptidase Rce1 family protein [Calothrix sp. PCC 7507]|uniref:CPBP family glutamic-type intramembrane protease n=1 Tax=Calothrix sp. PCC 7507 TaxID=99598 RepID=UPI0002E0DF82|nr:CPBP family glutamic-type intramembrane protease [Calothrix sp. PCC 7507]